MTLTVTPVVDTVLTSLRAFLLDILPADTIVLRGPINRAPQPVAGHAIMTPIFRKQLRTNIATDFPLVNQTELEQGTQLDVQIDFYGPESGDWAAMFSTAFRDEYGVAKLAPSCAPLYADAGRMIPLVTGEEQYLERWAVTASLQYNPVTTIPQEYADALTIDLINVDERYQP